jgi:hypothetical protein
MHFGCARCFGRDLAEHPEVISGAAVRDADKAGRAVLFAHYIEGLKALGSLHNEMHAVLYAILSPNAVGEAPFGLRDTGPFTFNYPWTTRICRPAPCRASLVSTTTACLVIARWFESVPSSERH